jgi:predicted ABC-type ATPase
LAASVALALGVVRNAQAKGGTDCVRDKAERKAPHDVEQLAKGGHDITRDKAERKAIQDKQQLANSVA